jgi:protein-L-isoaspartate O-methyltransferase
VTGNPTDPNTLLVARAEKAAILDLGWRQAMTDVRREAFAPDAIWADGDDGLTPVNRERDPGRWAREVHAAGPIVTQVDGAGTPWLLPGRLTPTSSISATDIVLRMLYDARIGDGERVLELGTGSGWNTGLLCHRVGDENVASVELDPGLAEAARMSLARAGFKPTVATGDAAVGYSPGAAYDTVMATFSVDRVPPAWIGQARIGGYVLAPWRAPHGLQAVIRLVATGPGRATGHFTVGCDFMPDRTWSDGLAELQMRVPEDVPGNSRCTGTTTNCGGLFDYTNHQHAFAVGLRVGGFRHVAARGESGDALWLYSTSDGSWAYVYTPDDGSEGTAYQAGGRSLWDEVEAALAWYEQAGQPGVSRFGMTVAADGWRVWLDEPGNHLPQVSPGAVR